MRTPCAGTDDTGEADVRAQCAGTDERGAELAGGVGAVRQGAGRREGAE